MSRLISTRRAERPRQADVRIRNSGAIRLEMPHHDFTCNIGGNLERAEAASFGRESSNCGVCSSSIRYRSLVHHLSLALFGKSIILRDFPQNRRIRGVGMSDWDNLAIPLAQ